LHYQQIHCSAANLALTSYRLSHKDIPSDGTLRKVNRSYWLRANPKIQRIKQNIEESRDNLKSQLALLGFDDRYVRSII